MIRHPDPNILSSVSPGGDLDDMTTESSVSPSPEKL